MYKPFTAATAELTMEQNPDVVHLFEFKLIYKVLFVVLCFFSAKLCFISLWSEHLTHLKLHSSL